VARILIVGGGCRGRTLARGLIEDGHAARITTRDGRSRAAIEEAGAECWPGTPDRLATLRGAMDGVTILAWLLGSASGGAGSLRELYTTRLELFVTQAIDTTVRGFIFEAAGPIAPGELLVQGEAIVTRLTSLNVIPVEYLRADPGILDVWLASARLSIEKLLAGR
jgi:hypothetical protein